MGALLSAAWWPKPALCPGRSLTSSLASPSLSLWLWCSALGLQYEYSVLMSMADKQVLLLAGGLELLAVHVLEG